ncbi:MAG: hypothetical protein ACREQA_07015 [Candidatus Binatia bacterium]
MVKAPTYNKSVEIYLESSVMRGTIVTRHARLSDYLEIPEEIFFLQKGSLGYSREKPLLTDFTTVIIAKKQLIFLAQLTPDETVGTTDTGLLEGKREPQKVLLGAGPFWLQGNLHFVTGVTWKASPR